MKQFWMVWNMGGGAPTYQHDFEHQAEAEAERLARRNPGQTFVVLEATSAVKITDVSRINLRTVTDDIPF